MCTDSGVKEGLEIHFLNGLRKTGFKICPCMHALHIRSLLNSYWQKQEIKKILTKFSVSTQRMLGISWRGYGIIFHE